MAEDCVSSEGVGFEMLTGHTPLLLLVGAAA